MIESQVRALFTEIAESGPGPTQVDTQLAHRRGRTRLRLHRARMAGVPVLAAAAVAGVALAVGAAGPSRSGPGPVPAGPAAPRQFSPLDPYLSFGWLPAGISPVGGTTSRQEVSLSAAPKPDSRVSWSLNVDAAGQCHLTGLERRRGWPPARELRCSTPAQKGGYIPVSGRAPAVRGHRAFWAGPLLVWQYARNGWAELMWPFVPGHSPKQAAYRRDAIKVASHVRYGAATPPLLFPVQLTGLPGRWRVSSLTYQPDGGVLRVGTYALGAGPPDLGADGGLVYQTGLPYFDIGPAGPRTGSCYADPHHSTREIINGYRVVVTRQVQSNLFRPGRQPQGTRISQDLCAGDADGLSVFISQYGAHPAISTADMFGHHMRLLGRHPAGWTTKPIG